MTNQIKLFPIKNFDACSKSNLNCPSIHLSGFPAIQSQSGDVSNIVCREVKNMTNYTSKLKIFGMIITVPMVFMANINPVLSISLSQLLESENSQSSLTNSLLTSPNNYDTNTHNYSQVNISERFLTSDYYSKDCRRRKVCDD